MWLGKVNFWFTYQISFKGTYCSAKTDVDKNYTNQRGVSLTLLQMAFKAPPKAWQGG
jgi:hypothetical protein